MEITIENIINLLKKKRFELVDEKVLQDQMHTVLIQAFGLENVKKEYELVKKKDIIDFLLTGGIGIEVKTKLLKRKMYNQCCRYVESKEITKLILATCASTGWPEEINGKDCYVINLEEAWL